jgi:hypothetical protein
MTYARELDRTVRLIRLDLFPGASRSEVLRALTSSQVRLRTTTENLETAGGQTAFVTTLLLVAELGASISVDITGAYTRLGAQPPLRGDKLDVALRDLSTRLIRPLSSDQTPDIEIVFGDTPATGDARFIRLEASDWASAVTGNLSGSRTVGQQPFGPAFAATAAAAEVFRSTMRTLAESGHAALSEHYLGPSRDVSLRFTPLERTGDVGVVDVISAGALSTAALYLLLRVPGLTGRMRFIDNDTAALDNLNRYLLFTRKVLGHSKVGVLADLCPLGLDAVPIQERITAETIGSLLPLADRVMVGVDHIPSRWLAQRYAHGWIGVAATSHFEAVVSEHDPTSACAGCLHPYDDDGEPTPIPTISFVSAFAGFSLAYRLLRVSQGHALADATVAYPFNLSAPRAVQAVPCAPHPKCPVGCVASMRRLALADSDHQPPAP